MEIEIIKLSESKQEVKISIPADIVADKLEENYRELLKVSDVPGFRRGKVPRSVLVARFGKYVNEDVAEKLIHEYLPKALEEKEVSPVVTPLVDPGKISSGSDFLFTATVEVIPDFEVPTYTGRTVEQERIPFEEEMIEKQLHHLREQNAIREPIEGRPLENGDIGIIDFYLTRIDNGEVLGEEQGTEVKVGSNQLFPDSGFEQKLIGAQIGEALVFPIEFARDYSIARFAGMTVQFRVNLRSLKREVLPELSDEFAKEYSEQETLAELRAATEKQIREALRNRMREQAFDHLLYDLSDELELAVPEALVEERLQRFVQYTDLDAKEEMTATLRPMVERMIKRELILDRVITAEKLEVSEEEVDGMVQQEAERSNRPAAAVKAIWESKGLIERMKDDMRQRKVMEFLMERNEIREIDPVEAPAAPAEAPAATAEEEEIENVSDHE